MSYNYLPLDKNPTDFQQIKNLLAHEQLVSITFDAYDRITKCRNYLDEKMSSSDTAYYGINTGFGCRNCKATSLNLMPVVWEKKCQKIL